MGLITVRGSHRSRWRTYSVSTVVIAAMVEAYWLLTVPIEIPRGGTEIIWVRLPPFISSVFTH
jgi:hypothetical protein